MFSPEFVKIFNIFLYGLIPFLAYGFYDTTKKIKEIEECESAYEEDYEEEEE